MAENWTDSLAQEDFARIELRVFRQDRPQSWNEEYLALGYLWTVTDYGRAWVQTDGELLARIRQEKHRVQACKVASDDGELCDYVAVLVHPQGYSLKAIREK